MGDIWQLGLALGLAVDAGLLLAAGLAGWTFHVQWIYTGGSILTLCAAGLPTVVGLLRLSWSAYWTHRETVDAWERRGDPVAVEAPDELEPEPANHDNAVYRQQRAIDQLNAHWDEYWQRLVHAGDAYGFTNSVLTTEGAPTKVMSDDAWKKTIPTLVWAGWLAGGKPGKPTKWAPRRTLELFEAEQAWKILPHPNAEPPDIAAPPYRATTPQPATPRATAVIDGRATPAD